MNRALILYKGTLSDYEFSNIYIRYIKEQGITNLYIESIALPNLGKKKVPKAMQKEWIETNKEILSSYNYLLVTDADFFKTISNQNKAMNSVGNIFDTTIGNKAIYVPAISAYLMNKEKLLPLMLHSFKAIKEHMEGTYSDVGTAIIHSESYPSTTKEIKEALEEIKNHSRLYCDIEARSLKLVDAGIYTIGFSWDKHNGIAFAVDASIHSQEIRKLLLNFFREYKGKLVFHKANYDVPVICFNLFQNSDIADIKGQIEGLNTLCANLDDTLLISYLATNNCGGNSLKLKELAQPYAGDWAVDVEDVTKVPLNELLRYNLVDCLSTAYVFEYYYPKMVEDNQETLYLEQFLPYLKDNMRCQMNGLPINLEEVQKLKEVVTKEIEELTEQLNNSVPIRNATVSLAHKKAEYLNSTWKKKRTTWEEQVEPLNYSSSKQLVHLLYEEMALPILDYTKNKAPSTSKKTINKLIDMTENEEYKNVLSWLIALADADIIARTFIPAFEQSHIDKNGNAHLLGSFNLGSVVSGRLSSNNPNLQNLPASGSRFAKPVKKCFKSTNEWLFVGIDFASLEDRISALTTKDPNKLKVYTDQYDGHCLRAYAYFKDKMPDIQLAEENEICYKAKLNGEQIVWKASDLINFQGQEYTGEQFYEMVTNKRI